MHAVEGSHICAWGCTLTCMLKSAHAHVLNAQTQVCLRVHMYTHALVCTCMCMLQSTCMHTHVRMRACGVCKDCGVCQLDKQLVLGLLQHLMHRTCSVHYLRSTCNILTAYLQQSSGTPNTLLRGCGGFQFVSLVFTLLLNAVFNSFELPHDLHAC